MEHIAVFRPNLPKFLILGQDPQFQISCLGLTNLTCFECQISQHWQYISFLGPNLPGMRGLILVLMSRVCYLALILIFFRGYSVITACYLVITACYLMATGSYCSLLVVTARYRSLSFNLVIKHVIH